MKTSIKILIILVALTALGWTSQRQDKSTQTNRQDRVFHQSSAAGKPGALYVAGAITVKLKQGVGEFSRQTTAVHFGIQSLDEKVTAYGIYQLEKSFKYNPSRWREGLPDLSRIYKLSFPESLSVDEAVKAFSSDPNVEYAEAIPIMHLLEVPDDSLYSQMQHLPQIFAPQAWDIHKGENGTEEIIIAINDTGVDWEHVDLQDNIWQNMAEDADGDGHTLEYDGMQWMLDPGDLNGIDDDANGFTDDLIGWNFITNTGDPNPIPSNPVGYHGTFCAGISNGVTNNGKGIASISWNLSLMSICADQNNTLQFGWDGIIYAAENGADIISNSWGGFAYSDADQEVINYAFGLGSIVVAAAGNDNSNGFFYPAYYHNVIAVSSVNGDDTRAPYSNYNLTVDVSAPGGGTEGGILSTMPDNTYVLGSGTSAASPCIAGCLGLLKSYHPDWTNDQLMTQLLGTADNIDSLNPDYINMLGSGRVNAYRMLSEENVLPFLKLELTSFYPLDANGNGINEQGELVTLNFELHNYMPCYGADNVNVSISTEDPEIAIINGTCTVNVPPDSSFSILDQLQIQVSPDAQSHFANLTLHFEADIPITMGQEIDFEVLVAPSGIFVYEGEENARDYSGTFIADFLDRLGFDYTYSNSYPPRLLGFETVFLSHGNFGFARDKGTLFTEGQSLEIQEFLENGGNVYVEMGGMFFRILSDIFENAAAMKQLFGVSTIQSSSGKNRIDTLYGVESTPTEGMLFTGSHQLYNYFIDKLFPDPGAAIPFNENNYGNVAIMNDGSDYKTFYFSYSLAELYDRDAISSKYNILLKVMDFFGYSMPQGYLLSNFVTDKTVGALPLEVQFSDISISDPAYPVTSWQWDFNNDGTIDSYAQNPSWTYYDSTLYDVRLITFNGLNSDTLIRKGLITINYGYLVYDGDPNGNDYSGTFIRDYLLQQGYTVAYRNILPKNLDGFSAVFLSFGNYGSGCTVLDEKMAVTLTDYLEDGGYVYLEGAVALGFDQAGNTMLQYLFGLSGASVGTENPIDNLSGNPAAITHDMVFTGNSQVSNAYIDTYTPLFPLGIIAFTENNYGSVAMQQSGSNGCRTFCFSYALAKLSDGEFPNTREELLQRILNFFDMYTNVPEPVEENHTLNCHVFPNPFNANVTISYYLPEDCQLILEIFNSSGQQLIQLINERQSKGKHQVQWDAEGQPAGIYFYRISTIGNRQSAFGKVVVTK